MSPSVDIALHHRRQLREGDVQPVVFRGRTSSQTACLVALGRDERLDCMGERCRECRRGTGEVWWLGIRPVLTRALVIVDARDRLGQVVHPLPRIGSAIVLDIGHGQPAYGRSGLADRDHAPPRIGDPARPRPDQPTWRHARQQVTPTQLPSGLVLREELDRAGLDFPRSARRDHDRRVRPEAAHRVWVDGPRTIPGVVRLTHGRPDRGSRRRDPSVRRGCPPRPRSRGATRRCDHSHGPSTGGVRR